jgi:hypothetical protein
MRENSNVISSIIRLSDIQELCSKPGGKFKAEINKQEKRIFHKFDSHHFSQGFGIINNKSSRIRYLTIVFTSYPNVLSKTYPFYSFQSCFGTEILNLLAH